MGDKNLILNWPYQTRIIRDHPAFELAIKKLEWSLKYFEELKQFKKNAEPKPLIIWYPLGVNFGRPSDEGLQKKKPK